MAKLDPTQGGCWFCHTDEPPEMLITREWDANFHRSCLEKELETCDKLGVYNFEAETIAREIGIIRPKRNPKRNSERNPNA